MSKTALIYAEAAEERRAIAQLVKPTGLFAQIYFSSTSVEVEFLLQNTAVDILFCDIDPAGKQARQQIEKLADLGARHRLPLLLCTGRDPRELQQLGAVAEPGRCLRYDAPTPAVSLQLKQLLGVEHQLPGKVKPSGALIDKTSGVYNRFYFDAILDQEISRSKLTGRPFSLLLIEPTPQAKPDGNGWSRQLPSLALAIKGQVRTSDLLCRVEQQRLALLMPETSTRNAQRVLNRLRSQLAEGAVEASLPLSFGLASSAATPANRLGLLRAAEAAL